MNYLDICGGCLTYESSKSSCNFAYVRYDKGVLVCPCSKCLVKMICVTVCERLKKHRNKIKLMCKRDI